MSKIKVLIIEDSSFMRKLITEFLSEDQEIDVVATARNGIDGLKKMEEYSPDVITLDIEMPAMNGLMALKEIMTRKPTPVVMLSSSSGRDQTMQSMQMGAVTFIEKPSGAISLDLHKIKREMTMKVKEAAKANVSALHNTKQYSEQLGKITNRNEEQSIELNKTLETRVVGRKIVCIGTSTGGPRALHEVIPKLPSNLDAPVFIVQHMPAGFTRSLAVRLNEQSHLKVKEAENGEQVENGTVYIAPGGYHLTVIYKNGVMVTVLDQSPPHKGHRPSVDILFYSIAALPDDFHKVAVIMTGMGSDGADGIRKIKKQHRSAVIAEAEETCVVYGMPKAAAGTGKVDIIAPLNQIAKEITKLCEG